MLMDLLGLGALMLLQMAFAFKLHRFELGTAGRWVNIAASLSFGIAAIGVAAGFSGLPLYPYVGFNGWIFSDGVWFGTISTLAIIIYGY